MQFLLFSPKKGEKHTVLPKKGAWPPAAYDVIFRYHSNRFSPNSRQNVSKGYAYSYWKRQVLTRIRLGKLEEKLYGDPPPPLYVRGLRAPLSGMAVTDFFSRTSWRPSGISYHGPHEARHGFLIMDLTKPVTDFLSWTSRSPSGISYHGPHEARHGFLITDLTKPVTDFSSRIS